jgi:hypothetical protein
MVVVALGLWFGGRAVALHANAPHAVSIGQTVGLAVHAVRPLPSPDAAAPTELVVVGAALLALQVTFRPRPAPIRPQPRRPFGRAPPP